jgi:hypothetical protein
MSSTCFEPEGSKRVKYIKKIKILIQETNSLPEDEHLEVETCRRHQRIKILI